MDQGRDVLRPLAQRWHKDGEDLEPVVKVAAKLAVFDHLLQVTVGCGHQTRIHRNGAVAPQSFEFLLLEGAEELGLNLKGNVTDFVKEQRPLVRQLDAPDFLRDRPREGAPLVPEELEQSARNRRAAQFDEGALAPRAQVVDGARDQLLAGAGLSQNQRRGVGRRHSFHLLENAPQGRALADDLTEIVFGAELVFEVELLFLQPVGELKDVAVGQGVVDRHRHLVGHVAEHLQVGGREGVFEPAASAQGAQRPPAADERDPAARLHA